MKKYIFWTDKGYIRGDLEKEIQFVDKSNARSFSEDEIHLYRESIVANVFEFYGCKEVRVEII